MLTGISLAVAASLFFGSWAWPSRSVEVSATVRGFYLSLFHFLFSLLLAAVLGELDAAFRDPLGPILGGVMWGAGIVCGFQAISYLGVTRAIGIWVPIVILTSTSAGLVYNQEWAVLSGLPRMLLILGLLTLSLGLGLILKASKSTSEAPLQKGELVKGVLCSAVIGFTHGSFFIPLGWAEHGSMFAGFAPMGVGMLLSTFIITVFSGGLGGVKETPDRVFKISISALLIALGNYCAVSSLFYVETAIAYPITQASLAVNTLLGIYVFKEVKDKGTINFLLVGCFVVLVGVICLSFSKI